ncbi:peptidoglycan editing factor PgeF [Thiorhodococcus minor]|uniref:Purine nucleoside phosphorylase n=1 Tax=Thiorhodococcus minor TaxID=57489 RepID=A0A6M0K0N9_9GAMM|nr:peptidoglycan editing factor PgeF [Thiorhodococcus minor]NEV62901.1 peptidoglycan editing factor PgeF [Thiorhodococcus minor]
MQILTPDWPAPAQVRACSTTRLGGVSEGPYASLNLGDHVGDDPARVALNRDRLEVHLDLPASPRWLRQVHGCDILAPGAGHSGAEADGAIAATPDEVCVVMTADCLPILICDERGQEVAAVHAGWRGLANGVVDRALMAMAAEAGRLLAWLGPAIGPSAFEVGVEVRDQFIAADPGAAAAFRPSGDRWLADIFTLARLRLGRLGVERVYGGGDCTYSQPERFFSYRRDGVTGRMASLIWIATQ